MWKQYRKTLIPTQLMIVTICLIALFYAKLPMRSVLFYFAAMQLFALVGAMWAIRLRHKVEAAKKRRNGMPDLLV